MDVQVFERERRLFAYQRGKGSDFQAEQWVGNEFNKALLEESERFWIHLAGFDVGNTELRQGIGTRLDIELDLSVGLVDDNGAIGDITVAAWV